MRGCDNCGALSGLDPRGTCNACGKPCDYRTAIQQLAEAKGEIVVDLVHTVYCDKAKSSSLVCTCGAEGPDSVLLRDAYSATAFLRNRRHTLATPAAMLEFLQRFERTIREQSQKRIDELGLELQAEKGWEE